MNQPHRGIGNASFCAAIGLAIGLLSSCATGTDSTTAPQSTADAPRTSSVEFNALRVAVVAAVSPADLLSVAVEDGRLAVQLMPDQEPIARSLAARYGDQLQITLGALPYPPGKTGAGRRPSRR